MLIYPPYRVYGRDGWILDTGYALIFDLPFRATVDVVTLLAQWGGVLIIGAIAYHLFSDKRHGEQEQAKSVPPPKS